MSSLTVRSAFRDAWPIITPAIPYVETINVPLSDADIAALPALWGSLSFTADGDGPVTMGSNPWSEETGTVSVALFGSTGDGDSSVAQAAEDVRKAWGRWISTDQSIWVKSVSGIRPVQDAAVGNWLVMAVDLSYSYQHRP